MAVNIPAFASQSEVLALTPLGIDGNHNALRAIFL
jgi:hypothetical protein